MLKTSLEIEIQGHFNQVSPLQFQQNEPVNNIVFH